MDKEVLRVREDSGIAKQNRWEDWEGKGMMLHEKHTWK